MKRFDKAIITGTQKRKIGLAILLMMFVAGVIAGTILVCLKSDSKMLESGLLNHNIYKTAKLNNILGIFKNSFLPMFLLVAMLFLCGFFAVGQPFEIFALAYRGAAVGIAAALTYLNCGIKGFLIILIMILPYAIISSAIILLAAREAIRFSNGIAHFAFSNKIDEIKKPDIKLYIIKFIVIIIFILISSVIDSLLTYLFTDILLIR